MQELKDAFEKKVGSKTWAICGLDGVWNIYLEGNKDRENPDYVFDNELALKKYLCLNINLVA